MMTLRGGVALTVALTALGLAAGAAPALASSTTALEGAWSVAQALMNGRAPGDAKLLNATWTFRGTTLVVQNVNGERLEAALAFDTTAEPAAVHVTPLDPPGERPLWIIWARQGGELRLAFYDGVERGRPEDFGPRRKLVVLTLVPASGPSPPVARDPCEVLRAAGVEGLLGGPTKMRPEQRRASPPGSSCALDRTDGASAVSLTLVPPPAGPAFVDATRREVAAGRRVQITDEPALGAGAFSGARGWTVVVAAHRRGTAMILTFEAFRADPAEVRRFAARVLDAL